MSPSEITVEPRPGAGRVDVAVDGDPFTAYRYPDDRPVLAKPVLFPLRAASGAIVTRGFPLEPRDDERTDHPHHIGHFFGYGADPGVNGVDFWEVADTIPPSEETGKGVIRHRGIERAAGGEGVGELAATMDWVRGDGRRVLCEDATFRFRAGEDRRVVDRISTLTAADGPVSMPDDKEGMFAVRVATGLEHPTDRLDGIVPTYGDEAGSDAAPTRTGEYLSSEGVRGLDVWGTRAKWMRLSGRVDGDDVSITIMDHPDNVGYPTHWHARGYGLFSANPLGRAVFTDGEERLGFELPEGESTTFRYRIAIDLGVPDPTALDDRHATFVKQARDGGE